MIISYIIIICLSAGFLAWAGLRIWRRVSALASLTAGAGAALLMPSLAFLIVVGAPPAMLVGALLLMAVMLFGGALANKHGVQAAVLLAAALLGLTAFAAPTAVYLAHVPALALLGMAGLIWFMLAASGLALPESGRTVIVACLASLAAVATAPLQAPVADGVALDAAIIASAFVGVLLARGDQLLVSLPVRMTLAFVIGYLQIAALWQGAWLAAAASMAIWLGTIGWVWTQNDPWDARHG